MAASFADAYAQLCQRYPDPQERGKQGFEPLVARVLRSDRRFSAVWLWTDWTGSAERDLGIDIVARRHDDNALVAVQCKDQVRISKRDLDSFIANSAREFAGERFVERLVVTTATEWSENAESALKGLDPPVQRIGPDQLAELNVDWDAYLADPDTDLRRLAGRRAQSHQKEAIEAVCGKFTAGADRGKLIMACGTGKTFTALRIAERVAGAGGRVLFAAPSLSLVAQALRDWDRDAEIPIRAFAVCSDPNVTARHDGDNARTYDLPIPVTTDAVRLAAAARRPAADRLTVVFSTYQSMEAIRDAQHQGMPAFDLVVCDEAHRTAGYTLPRDQDSHFQLVHNDAAIHAGKRLYMTATPRLYGDAGKRKAQENDVYLASMDDEAIYGPQLHHLGFPTAVEQGLLSDYRVLVLVLDERTVARNFQRYLAAGSDVKINDLGKVIGCLNGLAKLDPDGDQFTEDPAPMRRAVAFSNSIAASNGFCEIVTLVDDELGRTERGNAAEAHHIDGTNSVSERAAELAWLDSDDEVMGDRVHILSNARCLTEGIDVPTLDAVLFMEGRKSQIDVVQAVGRVMRKAEGKEYGYVILPVVVPATVDPADALDHDDVYGHVWQVLQALRSHDARLDAWVNTVDLTSRNDGRVKILDGRGDGGETAGGDEDAGQLPLDWGEHQAAILARIVERVGDRQYWRRWAERVADIARVHRERLDALLDGADPAAAARFDGFVAGLRRNLNDAITRDDAAAMLSQHMITRPVFEALFGGSEFTARNPVSQAMDGVLEEFGRHGLEAETRDLEDFYASVRRSVAGVQGVAGRQRLATELYDRFFRHAFPRDAKRLGIVYTPVEIVDFINRAAAALLERNFAGATLGDEGVHLLDPFTGTGTFIARFLDSGGIEPQALQRKYGGELHANEITLLAYYIAAVTIENAYHDALRAAGQAVEYEPFGGIVLTDTFQSSEATERRHTSMLPHNSDRIERQLNLDIRVILSNPPWSKGQTRHDDDNPNLPYPTLDGRIGGTYVARSGSKGLKNPTSTTPMCARSAGPPTACRLAPAGSSASSPTAASSMARASTASVRPWRPSSTRCGSTTCGGISARPGKSLAGRGAKSSGRAAALALRSSSS